MTTDTERLVQRLESAASGRLGVAISTLLMEAAAALSQQARDADLLAWLEDNEFDLVTRREGSDEDDQFILWWVVDSKKSTAKRMHSVSGHPLGSPREAMEAALATQPKERP